MDSIDIAILTRIASGKRTAKSIAKTVNETRGAIGRRFVELVKAGLAYRARQRTRGYSDQYSITARGIAALDAEVTTECPLAKAMGLIARPIPAGTQVRRVELMARP